MYHHIRNYTNTNMFWKHTTIFFLSLFFCHTTAFPIVQLTASRYGHAFTKSKVPSQPNSICHIANNFVDIDGVYNALTESPYTLPAASAILASLILPNLRLPGPIIDKATLSLIVQNTFLQNKLSDLQCVYRASQDGWSAIKFHEAVDGLGSAVVVARSRSGAVFGGYNPIGWRSTDDYYSSTSAFLWCFAKGKSKTVCKFAVLPGGNAAIFDYATSGPYFGSQDLLIGPPKAAVLGGFAGPDMEDISVNAGNLRQGRASVGGTYSVEQDWPVYGDFTLTELEVYCVVR